MSSVTITGGEEVAAYFRNIGANLESRVTIPATKAWAIALRDAMIKREHYRSGRMRSMTKVGQLGKYWRVMVMVDYAQIENSRRGDKRGNRGGGQGTPHRFAEPAMADVQGQQMSNFIQMLAAFLASP